MISTIFLKHFTSSLRLLSGHNYTCGPEHEIAVRAKKNIPAGTSSFLETQASYNLEDYNIAYALEGIFQENLFQFFF